MRLLTLLTLGLCLASATAAQTVSQRVAGNAGAKVQVNVQAGSQEFTRNSLGDLQLSRSAGDAVAIHGQAATGMAEARSRVEAGAVRVEAHASGSVIAPAPSYVDANAYGTATAEASFQDVLSFSAPGYAPGALFWATVKIKLDGTVSGGGTMVDAAAPSFYNGVASWRSQVQLVRPGGYSLNLDYRGSCGGVMHDQCTEDPKGWFSFEVLLVNQANHVLTLATRVDASGGALVRGAGGTVLGYGAANFMHTVGWGGVQALFDSDGALVSDFSFEGLGSGFDFRQSAVAVPEPSSALLLLLGVAAIWAKRRAFQRQQLGA
ncbi:PEP-CTERM sorting domain-containing protein [Paucibacter sp. XJ19-41]|uniref:PEP-CTERM sorting domain-containing protein n=1 Tax=Paucibacter sp. XJ19-41 TaxID=2927824 RepID=UPI002349CB88|nr:PEP-CTERM sorting domain-containing protein [Paucibacter sp. XJ19-41]MDC6170897.1 PEP-CTERM sorting domain-containing protein [Paucibacter sp. XJ19-41]